MLAERYARLGLTADQRPYQPYGTAEKVLYSRERELLVCGPAGTGKSRGIIEKHHLIASKYSGARILWLRKTRKRLTESTLVEYEDAVLPAGSPIKRGPQREARASYKYPNGSIIALLGLDDDNVDQIMSSQWDHIFIEEAIEMLAEVWDKCLLRLRNGATGYHQLVGATNPGPPSHWLKVRVDKGLLPIINAKHTDNPRFFNHETGEWTKEGKEYLEILDSRPGHLRDRYFRGLWVAAEGSRWPELDEKIQGYSFRKKFPHGIPSSWTRVLGVDYGLRAPWAGIWFARDHDGDYWAYRERYEPGRKAWQQAQDILDATGPAEYIHRLRMDPAMWADFPAHEEQTGKSAYDYYCDVINPDERFGPIEKGFNRSRMLGQITLDNLLARGAETGPNLWIDPDLCPNVWSEIQNAVWSDKERKEDIDEKCPDHAITATIYALHGHVDMPASAPPPPPTAEEARAIRDKEILENEKKRLARNARRSTW